MKRIILTLVVLSTLIACNNTEQARDNSVEEKTVQEVTKDDASFEKPKEDKAASSVILGEWVGEMNEKKLTIVIEEISGIGLVGYNILGSNKRNLKGTFKDGAFDQPCSKAYEAILNEPGDDEWDGVFTTKFVGFEDVEETETGMDCKGNLKGFEAYVEWKSNNGKKTENVRLEKQK